MTGFEEQLLAALSAGTISEKVFFQQFLHDVQNESSYVNAELLKAMGGSDNYRVNLLLPLIWLTRNRDGLVAALNHLLVYPDHNHHQAIARLLQIIKSPESLPFIRKALETGFGYLEYTCSEHGAIAKWFSHLLADINTHESIAMIDEFSKIGEPEIREEMKYRLTRVQHPPAGYNN